MAIKTSRNSITDDDVKDLTNKAYDRGGADVLKIVMDTINDIRRNDAKEPYVGLFTLNQSLDLFMQILDQVRESLRNVVQETVPQVVVPE